MIKTSLLIFALSISSSIGCSRSGSARPAQDTVVGNNAANLLNINTAKPDELRELPGIGNTLADRIVRYREANGPFRRVEHLMLVDGISENKFRTIRSLVRAQ